jgi:hypothetical protein
LLTTAQMRMEISRRAPSKRILVLLPAFFPTTRKIRLQSVCFTAGPLGFLLWWGSRPTRLRPTVCERLDPTLLPGPRSHREVNSGCDMEKSMSPTLGLLPWTRDTRMQARSPRHGRTWIASWICVDFTRRTLVSAGSRWIWARGCDDCVDWASQSALNGNGGRRA